MHLKMSEMRLLYCKSKEEGKDQKSNNQVPHPTQNTIWKSDKNIRKHHIQESQEVSPFLSGCKEQTRQYESLVARKLSSGFPTKLVSNLSPQLQRLASKLKFHL